MVLDDIVLEFGHVDDAVREHDIIERKYDLGRKPILNGGSQPDGRILWKLTIHNPTVEDRKIYTIQRYAQIAMEYDRLKRDYKKVIKNGQ